MIILEEKFIVGNLVQTKNLLLKLDEFIIVKCAETIYKVTQGIDKNNYLIYNSKQLVFNLNDFNSDLRSGIIHYNQYAIAYLMHDLLYSYKNTVFSRKESDQILKSLLIYYGKNPILTMIEYFVIRSFGRRFFGNNKHL